MIVGKDRTDDAAVPSRQDDEGQREKEDAMGDKGKKDKDKSQKQKINKQEQKVKGKLAKQPKRTPWQEAWWGVRLIHTVNRVMSLDGQARADRAASMCFSGRQWFKGVNTTIRDEVRYLITELQKGKEGTHAIQRDTKWCAWWQTYVPGMAQSLWGERPHARFPRGRRLGEGQERLREAGSEEGWI